MTGVLAGREDWDQTDTEGICEDTGKQPPSASQEKPPKKQPC